MAKQHPPRFLKLVNDVKSRIRETNVADVKQRLDRRERFHLIDVREADEWNQGHLPGAIHVGKGVIERDIEREIPDTSADIILYCGGGFRSALAAENLGRMGYTNVKSMDGGSREWTEAGFAVEKG